MKNKYSVDISKCLLINTKKEIDEILSRAKKTSASIQIRTSFSTKPLGKLKIKEIQKNSRLKLEMSGTALPEFANDMNEIELIIDQGADAYFMPVKKLGSGQEPSTITITVEIPKNIYKINRREFFRFDPSAESPIRVNFRHNNKFFDLYIKDISGGGFAVKIPFSDEHQFSLGDEITEIEILFDKHPTQGLQAKVVYIDQRTYGNQRFYIYGMQFVMLTDAKKDFIIKNIFTEHRKFIQAMKKRYSN